MNKGYFDQTLLFVFLGQMALSPYPSGLVNTDGPAYHVNRTMNSSSLNIDRMRELDETRPLCKIERVDSSTRTAYGGCMV